MFIPSPGAAQHITIDTTRVGAAPAPSGDIQLNQSLLREVTRPVFTGGFELGRAVARTSGMESWLFLPSTRVSTMLSGDGVLSVMDGRARMSVQGGTALSGEERGGFMRSVAMLGSMQHGAAYTQWLLAGDITRVWPGEMAAMQAQGMAIYYGAPAVLLGGIRVGTRERFGMHTPVVTASLARRWEMAPYDGRRMHTAFDASFRVTRSAFNGFRIVAEQSDSSLSSAINHRRTYVTIGDLTFRPQVAYGPIGVALDATVRVGRGASVWDDPVVRNEWGDVVMFRSLSEYAMGSPPVGTSLQRDRDGRASAMLRVMWSALPNLTVVGETGRLPSDPLFGGTGVRFTSLSLRTTFSLGARSSVRASRIATLQHVSQTSLLPQRLQISDPVDSLGTRQIMVVGVQGHDVHLNASFTGWRAQRLAPCAAQDDGRVPVNAWCGTFVVPQGAHQVLIRVDGGEWNVPPGLSAIGDGFDGKAGLLIVP